jgi:hypothetical protein
MIPLRTILIGADYRVRWHNLPLEIIEHPMIACVWNAFLLIAIRRFAMRINVRTSCILCGITGPAISMSRMWIGLERLLLEQATSDIDGMAFVQGWSHGGGGCCSADSAKVSRGFCRWGAQSVRSAGAAPKIPHDRILVSDWQPGLVAHFFYRATLYYPLLS